MYQEIYSLVTSSLQTNDSTNELAIWHIKLGLQLLVSLKKFLAAKPVIKEQLFIAELNRFKSLSVVVNERTYDLEFAYINLAINDTYSLVLYLTIYDFPDHLGKRSSYFKRIDSIEDLAVIEFNISDKDKIQVFIDDLDLNDSQC